MSHRHVTPTRLAATAILGGAALVAATLTTASAEPPSAPAAPAAAAPERHTPQGTVRGVIEHLVELEEIGDDHGDRAAGQPGYAASVDYVVAVLERSGYRPRVQEFTFPYADQVGPAVLEVTAPTPTAYEDRVDFVAFTHSASGDATGALVPVDLALDDLEGGTSGCEAADFDAFPAGGIALVRRGTCPFVVKVENAQDAGAAGVVVLNQGTEDRTSIIAGDLEGGDITVPVVGVSFDLGTALAEQEVEVRVAVTVETGTTTTWNVIAETRGDRRNVVVAGAHLDSVRDANGINDNASGSAALLEVAEKLADRRKPPRNRVRFTWFGAEERGLLGSRHYVADLAEHHPRALRRIALYLNFDMIASPNYTIQVYDGDNSTFPVGPGVAPGPAGSGAIERMFHRFYARAGTGSVETSFNGRSDYGPFIAENIPAGGVFTGAEGLKTEEEAALFGGTAGAAYDACYHQPCDDLGNISRRALRINTAALRHALTKYARSTRSVNGDRRGHQPPAR